MVKDRIFIVGAPRSGTTLVQCLLAAHSEVISFPETHFFERIFSERNLLSRFGIASPHARTNWANLINILDLNLINHRLPITTLFEEQYIKAFSDLLDDITIKNGKAHWVEKTPGHLHFIKKIVRVLNDAKFIHILRSGVDVVASLYEISQKYHDPWGMELANLDRCIEIWKKDTELSLSFLGKKNHFLVRYDALTKNPAENVKKMCSFLSISFEENMLIDYRDSAKKLVLKEEPWKSSVDQPIENRHEHKFHKVFSPEQRDYIMKHLPATLDVSKMELD